MKGITKEVKISLVAIAALVVLVVVVNFLKGINLFQPSSYYYIDFENVSGLPKSSPVYVDGFNMGIVRDITYNYENPGHVIVEIDMNDRVRIPTGSTVEISTQLLGSVDLYIHMNYSSSEFFSVGDTLQGYVNRGLMGTVSESLVPEIQQIMPKVDSLLVSLNALVTNPQIQTSIENIAKVTADLKVTTQQLNKLLYYDLPQLVQTYDSVGDNLAAISSDLKELDYQKVYLQLDSTLQNLNSITARLNSNDNSLGLLLSDSSLYNNLNQTAVNAALLLENIKANPKRYVHFSLFGRKN